MKTKKPKSKKRLPKSTVNNIFLLHPEWRIPNVSPKGMADAGYEEAFRVKSTDGFSKDEIWYRR